MKIERSKEPVLFFSKKESQKIVECIQAAETKTSGEIRLHLERKARPDILAHATSVFERIGMTRTQARNGVLIFLGVGAKRFAVIGDSGIHQVVPPHFWDDIASGLQAQFQQDAFATGICEAILKIGDQLSKHFPYSATDVNELPDEISYS